MDEGRGSEVEGRGGGERELTAIAFGVQMWMHCLGGLDGVGRVVVGGGWQDEVGRRYGTFQTLAPNGATSHKPCTCTTTPYRSRTSPIRTGKPHHLPNLTFTSPTFPHPLSSPNHNCTDPRLNRAGPHQKNRNSDVTVSICRI